MAHKHILTVDSETLEIKGGQKHGILYLGHNFGL